MRTTKLWIGISLFMILAVSLSGGVAFGMNPEESSPDQMITSSSDSFLKDYQVDQATDKDCLVTGNKQGNKFLLAKKIIKPPKKKPPCMKRCVQGGGDPLDCVRKCTPGNPPKKPHGD